MSDFVIDAQLRTEFGKGAARRLRRSDQIPAVIYGHGQDPVHVSLPERITLRALRTRNALVNINVSGESSYLGLVKDVQRDPVLQIIEHVDFLVVNAGEKVVVEVSLRLVGEAAPDTQVSFEQKSIEIEASVTNLPDIFEVELTNLVAGSHILASDVVLPEGVSLISNPDSLLVNIISKVSAAEEAEAE